MNRSVVADKVHIVAKAQSPWRLCDCNGVLTTVLRYTYKLGVEGK